MMTARTVVELSSLAPSPRGVEICSCDEALALRAELAAARARHDAEHEVAKASLGLPRHDLEFWARHGAPAWKAFARAALALPTGEVDV